MLGLRGLLPGPLAFTRQLYVSYLDEEVLVLRDESGVPDVLTRSEMFEGEKAGELSSLEDDAAPGAS